MGKWHYCWLNLNFIKIELLLLFQLNAVVYLIFSFAPSSFFFSIFQLLTLSLEKINDNESQMEKKNNLPKMAIVKLNIIIVQ